MYFLLSAAFLGWAMYWTFIKKDVPQLIHTFYYSQRKFDLKNDQDKPTLIAMFSMLVAVLLGVSSWQIVTAFYDEGIFILTGNVTGFLIWFGVFLVLVLTVGRHTSQVFTHYPITVREREQKEELKQAYGVKEWATNAEIAQRLKARPGEMFTKSGLLIGNNWHWNEKGHVLTVGGAGQGKGISSLIPAILSEGFVLAGISGVFLDVKGELAAITAPHLIRRGYDVHIVNPFGIEEIAHLGNSRFNPFDLIDPKSNDATKLYDVLAMSLHNRRGQGDNSFFDNRCRQYISLYLSYAHHVGEGNWDTVYKWLTLAGERREELLASMVMDEEFDGANNAQAISDRLTGDAAKTEESIYGTIEEAIHILKDKNLRASLAGSDFDLRTVSKKPTAIFICIPFEDLEHYSAWVRMFFDFLLRTLTRHYNVDRKVLVLLDEFAQLSYMDQVPKAAAVLRGYNVTLWPVVQGLGQLKTIYGDKWEIFINSAVIKHWLSSGTDNTTADYISHRMPQALRFIGSNPDGSPKEKESKLLDTNQVIGFPDIICEISGMASPARFKKVPYWDIPYAGPNASPNPFYA